MPSGNSSEGLKNRRVLKDSVIILTTDHGDEFAKHGGLSHDGKLYDELVHVPLILYEPHGKETRHVGRWSAPWMSHRPLFICSESNRPRPLRGAPSFPWKAIL